MSYSEEKDPLTGKGRRHTQASLAVLGLSKAIIEEEKPPSIHSKGEIQKEDKEFWPGKEQLEQGDILTWNRGNHVAIVSSPKNTELGNTEYDVAMLSPPSLRGSHINIDLNQIENIDRIENEDKEDKALEKVIFYWRDAEKDKINVGKGVINEVIPPHSGIMSTPDFVRYKVELLEDVDDYPTGYVVDNVYEYVGKKPLSYIGQPGYVQWKYKTNRLWRKIL